MKVEIQYFDDTYVTRSSWLEAYANLQFKGAIACREFGRKEGYVFTKKDDELILDLLNNYLLHFLILDGKFGGLV